MSPATVRQWRERSDRGAGRRRETPREAIEAWARTGGPLALFVCLIVFGSHLAWGANNDRLSLVLTAVLGLGLSALFWLVPGARRALSFTDKRLAVVFLLFAAAFVIALLGLTPWLPGGSHPVWTYVPGALPAVSVSRSETVLALIRVAGVGCAFLIGLALGRREDLAAHLFSTLLWLFSLFALWALYGFVTDAEGLFGVKREMLGANRLMGAFGSPNSAALLFGMGLILGVVDLMRTLRRYQGWQGVLKHVDSALPRFAAPVVCCLMCAADLTLTQSRVGTIAVAGALVALTVSEALRTKSSSTVKGPSLLIAGLVVLGLFLALVAYRPEIIARLMTAGQDLELRETIFQTHWAAIQASPWFGYGLGTFDAVNKLVATSENYTAGWSIRAMHDVFLEWIEGVGVMGSIPMFGAVMAANLAVADGAFRRERMAAWKRGILCISLVVFAMGLTDYGLEEPSIAAMWALLLGLGAGLGRR